MNRASQQLRLSLEHLYAWAPLHRTVPIGPTLRLVRWRADHALANPKVRYQAEAHMRFVVGKTERAHEVEQLAREYAFQYYKKRETNVRPWLATRDPVDGLGRLLDARSEGRGVVLHYLHHGQQLGMLASIARHGITWHAPTDPILMARPEPRDRRGMRTWTATGGVLFSKAGSYPKMLDLLGKGEVIAIASDVPGQGRMRFLGRNVAGASGVSRLAVESRAPVVPVTVRPEGVGQRAVVGEPIDSRAFTDPSRLLQEIMRQHEPSVLAWPEALLWPLERWRVSPEDVDELGLNDPRMTRPLLI